MIDNVLSRFPIDKEFTLSGSRLDDPFRRIILVLDGIALSTDAYYKHIVDWRPRSTALYGHKGAIRLPAYVFMRAALDNLPFPPVDTMFSSGRFGESMPSAKQGDLTPIASLIDDTIAANFLLYYEAHIGFVRSKCGAISSFEPRWGFARVVRNAIAHGRVNIADQNFNPVSWLGTTLGPSNDGQSLKDVGIVPSDLMILMIDLDLALENLGLPGAVPRLTGRRRE